MQNEAGASEVVLSEAVAGDPAVAHLLAAERITAERRKARLEGIAGEMTLRATQGPRA